jgi:transcriptional regulator with XRE-family HTH domain
MFRLKTNGMNANHFMRLIGERVRQRRLALGLSQEALAAAAGLHRTQINLIEHNRRKIRIETLLRIALALEIEPADLLPRIRKRG